MNRIKWIEDKSKNYRGNFEPLCFKVNNSNYIFAFYAYMSYKCFKNLARRFAQTFNCSTVEILEDWVNRKQISNMDVVHIKDDNFKFRIELDVSEGGRREFKYYTIEEVFN